MRNSIAELPANTSKKLLCLGLLVFCLFFAVGCTSAVPTDLDLSPDADNAQDVSREQTPEEGTYLVTRVVDGDTIEIDYNGVKEKVRLIGIDTPESVHADESKNTEYGTIASDFTKQQLEDKYVSLEFDVEERDKYDRLLAYVYLDGIMFNATLLEEGHAMVYTFPPNVKYADMFIDLQTEAREAKVGLWNDDFSYVGSRNSDKYHYANCEAAGSIKEQNKVWFADKAEAEGKGYSPCSRCNP